ncbi:MAG: helix-turn-helix transcriptional regulator [Planctomycetaceae bacterium]|jgi:transcriptional regulator with XRE-family HTH domain|nr:helix-turn-helix transcriptional regulator [Planctomycetaceae bacterium]MBT4011295.1 helix-turn-helix transcriptional regulator [Planctomycetaceae bacterium]MBT4724938.1 helix-turn-helix transcriptional regulator [Planctomycetaceae bacterium]MBT4846362.1 helix-turn-helix transcriptional regulator [Planctomycetaceae bacterium]MBT5124858.1 helix-turn-helix transcriptional regulator [Planctomycetaceae bacterium]
MSTKSVAELCREQQLTLKQLVEQSGVDEHRIVAILMGRWTPSSSDRNKIAQTLGVTRNDITWGHQTPIQHIYGIGPG